MCPTEKAKYINNIPILIYPGFGTINQASQEAKKHNIILVHKGNRICALNWQVFSVPSSWQKKPLDQQTLCLTYIIHTKIILEIYE